MKSVVRYSTLLLLIVVFLSSAMPCGPGYTSPMFVTEDAPEAPYTDFAAGRLGIVTPKLRRSVLIAAYRHIATGGLTTPEQQAMIDVWKAEIDKKDFRDDSVDEAVKAWVTRRKDFVKEEKPPEIYAERAYGGYDFFPNCTKNAFETALETLNSRASSYGNTDPNVLNWLSAQDQVFQNCSSGKSVPEPVPVGAPEWLQKDRAYQSAAAAFYALDYESARRQFAEIALDTASPWKETADYLVARTLIRQASVASTPAAAAPFYEDAEAHLARFVSGSGKFADSAARLVGLVRYRLHPRERVSELAKNITIYGGDNFRQDVIDYGWLLDKFESEVLTAEEKRKEAEKPADANSAVPAANFVSSASNISASGEKKNEDDLEIYVYSVGTSKSFKVFLRPDATDEEAIAEASKVIDVPLTDAMKTQIKENRRQAYAERFTSKSRSSYEGGYYGEELLKPSLVPAFLKQDEITDWLYTFQMTGAEAYLYSLKKYTERSSDLWLLTALTQAETSSTQLPRLLEGASKANRTSAAYPTIAYHAARILLAQKKQAEARKIIDSMLEIEDALPRSARNMFLDLRLKLAVTLEEYLAASLKKPFAFDFSGSVGTIDEIVAEQKTYFNPEYDKNGREAYEAEIESNYKEERAWENRGMFDDAVIDVFNQHFPTASLIEVYKSPALPEYMRPRFAVAIWMRAYLLNDVPTLDKFTLELADKKPEFRERLEKISAAKTPGARENALLYFVVTNPVLSPYLEGGVGKTDNEVDAWSSDDWWCEPYDSEYNDETNAEVPRSLPPRPPFLTASQSQTAQSERKKLKAAGDAPKYLAGKVLAWLRRAPTDRRIPEALYNMIQANGWTKYGCGNNEELREQMAKILKTRFQASEWAAKLISEEKDQGER